MSKDLDHDQWLKKYRRKLVYAWKNGFDDKTAAERVGISFDEYERHLALDENLREVRDKYVDELLRIAKDSIAEKIKAGDRQTCEWYLEHRDPSFGAKSRYEEVNVDETLDERRNGIKESLNKFMESYKEKPHKFDGGR